MTRDSEELKTFTHDSLEENLLSAKRALRRYRGARLHRGSGQNCDTLEIICGTEVMERHLFRFGAQYRQGARLYLDVERLALYQ